jgi:multiple sugar transport system ATP-binding protein
MGVYCVWGPGLKSTTLRMTAGLETISDGQIVIGGKVVNNAHPKDRGIGLAFENYALYPPLTIRDNLAFNLRAHGVNKTEIDKRVAEISKYMHVEELLDLKPATLSSGQKQRVNIARALIRRPAVLLLDEPLSHLDAALRVKMRTEIKRLNIEQRFTTIIVTHDQLEAMALADHRRGDGGSSSLIPRRRFQSSGGGCRRISGRAAMLSPVLSRFQSPAGLPGQICPADK